MRYFVFILLFLFCVNSCYRSKKSHSVLAIMMNEHEITVSFFDKLTADTVNLSLSSLVEECELVLLEYTEEAIFKPYRTTITEKYIGIIQSESLRDSYKLFGRSGEFLCSVGTIGQGPGEYTFICDDIIDDQNELIYLAPFIDNKILIYNTSGEFLKSIGMPRTMISPRIFISNDTLTVAYLSEDKSMITQINIYNEQILYEFTTQIPQRDNHILYNSKNMLSIFDIAHASYDTLYHIDLSNYFLRPVFIMVDNSSEERVIKLHYQLNKDLVTTIVRNKGFIISDLKNKRSSWVKVKNDYFGNLDIQISSSQVSFFNGYYVLNIQPEQLMEDIEQRLTESDCTEKDRQILQKTYSMIKETTNNVVFIGKLKKITK